MERFALLGWPVKHSLSPPMQEAGFRDVGIDAVYELIEVHPDDLPAQVQDLREKGYRGWNITVPHKEQMAALVDILDPEAAAAASVNTVVNRNGLTGYSTDGYGLATAIQEAFGLELRGRHVVFLGAGGAARAVAVYVARHGARAISVANRTLGKARHLVERVSGAVPGCAARAVALSDLDALRHALPDADVIIQSTSLGLHDGDPLPVDPGLLPPGVPVMDMIYGDTPFLRQAAAQGCPTADGRGMLLHQGVRSFEIWTGLTAPVETMRRALDAALAQRRP